MRSALASVLTTTSSRNRPWQIALGFGLGMFCGSVGYSTPMLAICLAIGFALPLHLPVYLLGTVIGSFAVTFAAPGLAALGSWSLTHPQLTGLWTRLDHLPLVPWLGLHNALIHGGMLAGLALLIPNYLASWLLARACLPKTAIATEHDALDEISIAKNSVAIIRVDAAEEFDLQPSHLAETLERTQSDAQGSEELEESFVELSEIEMQWLKDLDFSTCTADPNAELTFAFDSPSNQTPAPSTPIPSRDTSQPSLESAATIDAMARLEELLSGCRVQPHWTHPASSDAAESVYQDESAGTDDATGQLHFRDAADPLETRSSDNSQDDSFDDIGCLDQHPSPEEILARSGEIVGLVDELIASLDSLPSSDSLDNDPGTIRLYDGPQTDGVTTETPELETSELKASEIDLAGIENTDALPTPKNNTQSENALTADTQTAIDGLKDSAGTSLRYDQIDISAAFSEPLYQPHIRPQDDTAKTRAFPEVAFQQPIPLDANETQSSNPQENRASLHADTESHRASRQANQAPASYHFVENGHQESLRYLLQHLKRDLDNARKEC